ncbi:MAG: EFR1 family ferrodoxin [Victivallaceae bacterium]
MIYFFSATGNSEFVARELAAATGDRALAMIGFTKKGVKPPPVRAGETLGIVFPVYAWRPPRYVVDFVKSLQIEPGAFVYGVCTMGEVAGDTFRYLGEFIRLDSCYSVKMPGNYIIMSQPESEEKINRKIVAARGRIGDIAAAVRAKKAGFDVRKGPAAYLFTYLVGRFAEGFFKDHSFHASIACTGCGRCVEVCPLDNITLEAGKPIWHGNCMHCVACIQRCPVRAIEFGEKTAKRARYIFPEA